ncbi:MAG TPA: class I SAM-dependent methyltransferase [Kiritimatiellia bacterium]|nr:class I SAM-dependent methyltransferase [Kiritimatiellia bacterium]HMP97528.1 class I SAM-dependent methyltransferase [Kiritimatiellia bacterium]
MTCGTTLDTTKMDAFADRYVGMLNSGMTAMMISIGHRAGLFDAMADGASRTSSEWAEAAGLHERYVREWLAAMVVSRIIERDATANTFRLPGEHAHWLCRKAPVANLAVFAQYLPLLAQVEDQILDCFRQGGGLPYEAYSRFHDVMAEDSGQTIVPALLDHVVPLIPGWHERLTNGIDVLDVGCGKGRALMALARAYPNSFFTGYDLNATVIEAARKEAGDLPNIRFEVRDLTHWDEPAAFDWVLALDAIHDQARPDLVLSAIRRTLRPGGAFFMQDIDANSDPSDNLEHPLGAFLYAISTMHCMPVSLAQGGMGLGTAWGVQLAERMLREAGFDAITTHRFPHDSQNVYFIMKLP